MRVSSSRRTFWFDLGRGQGVDYVIGLKGNQGSLRKDVELFFDECRERGIEGDFIRKGSVHELYAWTCDGGCEASPGRGVLQFKPLEPSQVVVEISGRDASVAPQEILQPAVSVVDRRTCCDLNVKGTSHPFTS